jgi:hypothetical protein
MKKVIFAIGTAVLLITMVATTVQAGDNTATGGGIGIQAVLDYTDTGWGPTYSEASDCDEGWGDDEWEFTNTAFGFLTITVEDCCLVGDYYEIWVDGILIGTTPDPGLYGTTNSVGSATVWLAPGTHTIEIRDALFESLDEEDLEDFCPAGYWVTGEWEPVVEFTKEIKSTTEGGDGDGILETGEKWEWVLRVELTNVSGETIHIGKVHDRVGGDLESGWILYYSPLGPLDVYTRGKTEKVFYDFEGDFDLADGATAYFEIWVSPDKNTGNGNGKNNNFPDGHQEYTSPGEHCLNSGAWFEGWIDDEYIEGSTEPVCVEVEEAD